MLGTPSPGPFLPNASKISTGNNVYLQYTVLRSNDVAQGIIFMVSAPVSTNGTLNMKS